MATQSTQPLSDAWYLALPSARLKRGTMVARIMLDQPILLGRGADGNAFALLDICPHRGIPLHYGTFDGGEVQCGYHGWRFGADGGCTAIPPLMDDQQPDLTKIRVQSFPVEERYGAIWLFFGKDKERAPALPVIPELDGRAPKLAERMVFECGIDQAVIGLMDPAHGPYVHNSWFWRRGPRPKAKQFEASPWGFTMARHPPSSNSLAYRLLGDPTKLTTEIVFQLPSIRYERINAGRHAMCHFTALTPLDDRRTEINHFVYWTMPWLDPVRPLLRPLARKFLDQDRQIVQRQQEGLRYNPTLRLLGDPDVPARWYYQLKNEFLRARDEGRAFENPVRGRMLQWRS